MSKICSVKKFLNDRPIFYKKIDYERFPKAYESIKDKIPLKNVIQIIGTNGKGSTGRFLANAIAAAGFRVGHYTSPHIFRLNERIYLAGPTDKCLNFRELNLDRNSNQCLNLDRGLSELNLICDSKSPSKPNLNQSSSELAKQNFRCAPIGRDVSDVQLQRAHEFLQESLPAEFKDSLSYFEYLTLAAAVLFRDCDYCVIEAGMGGEFDATSSFGRTLSLFTPIGTDHLGMLGQNLEQIAHTKLIMMDKEAILSDEMSEVPLRIAQQIAEQKGTHLRFATELLSKSEQAQIAEFCAHNNLPKFQISNLALALAAMKFLNLKFEISQLPPLNLRGRMEALAPNLRVDVGHNELAAQQVAREITEIYGGKKIVLIYNAFADKDVAAVLRTLAPVVERVEIFNYEVADREMAAEAITRALDALKIPHSPFRGELRADEEYLVFGSFHLVENFILWLEARRG